MSNLFSSELEDKFVGAKEDKVNSQFKDKIAVSLTEPSLQEEWLKLKSSKFTIRDESGFDSYITSLSDFFNKVCEKITAPGVDAFIEWINDFGRINELNANHFREHLINNYQYSDYSEKIEIILENRQITNVDANSPKLFDSLLKNINKSIKSDIDKVLNKVELFETTVIPFLDKMSNELSSLSEVKEISVSNIAELYTESQANNAISFYQDIIEDAIKYIQEPKTKYAADQDDSQSGYITRRIEDLRSFISSLDEFKIVSNSNPTLLQIFEKSKISIIGKEGSLDQNWSEFETKTWCDLEAYHDSISQFFSMKDQINLTSLSNYKSKWQLGVLNIDLSHIIDKYKENIQKNPLNNLSNYSTSKGVRDELFKKFKSIEELKLLAESFKTNLFDLIADKIEEYTSNKIPTIKTLSKGRQEIKEFAKEINDKVEALGLMNSEDYQNKEFLVFLASDFDGFYDIYESIDESYTGALAKIGLKESIDWLNTKMMGSEELNLTQDDLKDPSRLVELLKVNLIKLSLAKNI